MSSNSFYCTYLLFFGIIITYLSPVYAKSMSGTSQGVYAIQPCYDDSTVSKQIGGHWVDIVYPSTNKIRGNILVLPGWSFSRQDWCQKSNMCKTMLEAGYCLILPEMSKSVYASQYFPETRQDWRQFPTLGWVIDIMLPQIQKEHGLLLNSQHNFLLGLSTGGRGVALIALARPDLFKAAAALSGDFDQTKMPKDRLMIGFYGEYSKFPNRWEGKDNPQKQIQYFKTPIYLGHGTLDKIVPPEQTTNFYKGLKEIQADLEVILHMPEAAHDYTYWSSETSAILTFFKKFS